VSVSTVGLARQPAWPRTPGALKRVSSRNRTHGGVAAHARAGILCRNGAAARSARLIGGNLCETRWMRYVKVTSDGGGGSRFEDAEVVQAEMPYTENTPPVLVSSATPATEFAFVTLLPDVRETA